ncbi:MAG: hypothetical protein HGA76_10380, partial [Candidatus Firestonebacteria bacterium]|nr:hypothetical protein [Candidatus Firestonebacteria bacterium]
MQMSQEAVTALKENFRLRREHMLKLLDLEQHWPVVGEWDEELSQMQKLVQAEHEILNALETLMQKYPLPASTGEAFLAMIPPQERPEIERDLNLFRELTILILDWHQKNAGQLNLRAEDLAQAL